MYELRLHKPDGRALTLYSRRPISPDLRAPSPQSEPSHANPALRWHPFRGEWVAYAPYRQDRVFLPPARFNPLLPSNDPAHPTELPVGMYDIAVFDNLSPSMKLSADAPLTSIVATAPARGHCEVVVFTQDPDAALATLPLSHLELLIDVWGRRSESLLRNPQIHYVLPFEN
ncbi:MAG: galactose-1-phosphate uridylyltransferase, partial [Pseudomonadota bacterium]|nr:galactose-1-phosphate uridylyltransferase [Pseudomonadota bacterium]